MSGVLVFTHFKDFFRHVCENCKRTFARKQQLQSHRRSFHDKVFSNHIACELCKKVFENLNLLRAHLQSDHEKNLTYKKIK